ncbi:MAG TPA: type I-U CRISPR-associated helicase/endonuclease Cas3 [Candidatus Dormibacteraeota bacterium]|nr:type I-U CRISPR-associated helicase/endonuclease Cas3 [Candidatus Dormibacteraeota bacterium]
MAEVPSFEAFFRAVNRGREPFPWQRGLAARVAEQGWPDAIGVPTGLGKTACLDIAVWALARAAAAGPARTTPTRVWYVVNRRLLIDTAHDHARHLQELLARPDRLRDRWEGASDQDVQALEAVAEALHSLAVTHLEDGPLHVVRLRGGAELGARPPDPAHPSLILATVPMFASRLLFRGYGSSTSMRPVDTALAATDSLVLLDEAHLARPLTRLVGIAAECDLGDPGRLLPGDRARCRLVALTATGEEGGERFDLGPEDHECEEVRKRLRAAKPVELVATTRKDLAGTLAARARQLLAGRPGSTCVVFCNTVDRARGVMQALEGSLRRSDREADLMLLTGRMREHEAGMVRGRLLDREWGAPAGRDPEARRARDLIVVATQTLEVGADLDFDFLVTETAGARALVQRLGRLNRLGDRPHARGVICHPEDQPLSPPYGTEPSAVWGRLRAAGEWLDLAPERVAELMGRPRDQAPEVGELLPDHLWELAKTSFSEPGEPPVELFFEGVQPDADVSVCWRARLPEAEEEKLLPPLREEEAIEVPLGELRSELQRRGMTRVQRLASDRARLEEAALDDLRPGDQVVLPASTGLYDQSGWNPEARGPVLDLAPLREGILWFDEEAIRNLVGNDLPEELVRALRRLAPAGRDPEREPEEDLEAEEEQELIVQLLDSLASLPRHPWLGEEEWAGYLDRLKGGQPVRDAKGWRVFLEGRRLARDRHRLRLRADALEELSFGAGSALLADHLEAVGGLAGRVAERLGLPRVVVASLERAGRYHDLGKHDLRFQRWLNPQALPTEPLAKSGAPPNRAEPDRVASGWPKGGRHELLSVRLLVRHLEGRHLEGCDPELVLHLVAAHHGHGRPWIRLAADDVPGTVSADLDGMRLVVRGDLSEPDWEQPRRFRRLCERYGVWGLALLEAILRQSDHIVSEAVEVI